MFWENYENFHGNFGKFGRVRGISVKILEEQKIMWKFKEKLKNLFKLNIYWNFKEIGTYIIILVNLEDFVGK